MLRRNSPLLMHFLKDSSFYGVGLDSEPRRTVPDVDIGKEDKIEIHVV